MAGREERLPPATRNYVILGLLFVVAVGLAVRERFGVKRGRGEADSALRLLVIDGTPTLHSALDEVDGFSVTAMDHDQAVSQGRELLDDDDAPAYVAAVAHADQLGYGFVLIGLSPPPEPSDTSDTSFDWGLTLSDPGIEAIPPDDVAHVAFSVGDLAPEGPRMHFARLAKVAFREPVGALDSARLALAEHPDFLALWEREGNAHLLQARQVLSNRGWVERGRNIRSDQDGWATLVDRWPTPGTIPHSLGGDWEQVQAAPVHGGLLIEVRAVTPTVGSYRHVKLERAKHASLYFVARTALEDSQPDESRNRQRCAGLPETVRGQVVVAPDGAALSIHDPTVDTVTVYRLSRSAGDEGRCQAEAVANMTSFRDAVGRPNAGGRIAWSGSNFLVWHEGDASYSPFISGLDAYSGPWWVDDTLLAMISERELGPPSYGVEPVLTLFDTRRPVGEGEGEGVPLEHEWVRADLDARALFEPLGLEPGDDGSALIDLRPMGPHELLLLTERCPEPTWRDLRPCAYRLRADRPLIELTAALARAAFEGHQADAQRPPIAGFEVEQLGPIGPSLAPAVAADGGRVAWVDVTGAGQVMIADLHGQATLEPRRIDSDDLPDGVARIAADGRIVSTSVRVSLGELGEVSVARAFVLPAPAQPSGSPSGSSAGPTTGPTAGPTAGPAPGETQDHE